LFNAWKADRPTGFIDNSEDVPVTVAALIPSSHRSELEQRVGRAPTRKYNGAAEAENRAQALKAELSKANLKLEEARKYKEQAELAR
jgi:hypothetical protein